GLPRAYRRRLRTRRRARARALSRRQGRGRSRDGRARAQGLPVAPRLHGRNLPGVLAPARHRCLESHVRARGGRMTQPAFPPIPPEQRTWLNAFFAGLLSLDGGVTPLSAGETAALMGEVMGMPAARGPLEDGDDGAAPWHDQALPLGERMKLAENRPLRRRMM